MIHARRRAARSATLTVALALLGAAPSVAETLEYGIDVPAGRSVTFHLDLEVRHPGRLAVEAAWSGRRNLALRLEPPVSPWGTLRRSGPSPQRLETTIVEGDEDALGTWRLQIHALAARGSASGTLTVRLPEPAPPPTQEPDPATSEPPAPPPDPWLLPRRVERGLPSSWERFVQAVERFRSDLAEAAEPDDACRWQDDLMRYLAERRDRLVDRGQAPADSTREVLSRISAAIEHVEQLRTSDDPLLVGPPPADPRLAATWRVLRAQRIREIESELDSLLELVHRAHSPELEDEPWTGRLVSCLTACERFFEQRTRIGDERATNRDLTGAQWTRLLLAAEALEALARLRTPGER